MNLIQSAKYDINDKVQLIIQEVQDLLKKCEDEARAIYYPETNNKEGTTK